MMRDFFRWFWSSLSNPSNIAHYFIAIFTLALVIFAYNAWTESQRTTAALDAANRITTQNIYELQRPFITAIGIGVIPIIRSNAVSGIDIWPNLTNAGNTPTKTLNIYINHFTPVDEMPNDYGFPDTNDVVQYPTVAAPHLDIKLPVHYYTLAELRGFQTRARHAYIYGRAVYTDIFKNTPEYITRFCFELSDVRGADVTIFGTPPTGAFNEMVGLDWRICRRHNCMDNECHRQGFDR